MYNVDVALNAENSVESAQVKKKFPTILGSSILYLIVPFLMIGAIFFEGIGYSLGYQVFMTIFQVAVIGLPAMIYMLINKIDIKDTIRLNRISFHEILSVVGLAISGYLVIIPINVLWQSFLYMFGEPFTPELPPMENGLQYFAVILSTAVTPALVEEFMFRGVIQRGYERIGVKSSIIITGVLFGILHGNIAGLPTYIILGILLGYIVYRTNSIWAGIIYHFINNTISISLTYLMTSLGNLEEMEATAEAAVEMPGIDFATILMTIFLVVCIIFFFVGCLIWFNSITKDKNKLILEKGLETTGFKFVQLIPAVIAFLFITGMLILEFLTLVMMG